MLRAAGIDQRAVLEDGEGVYACRGQHPLPRPAKLDDDLVVVSTRSDGAGGELAHSSASHARDGTFGRCDRITCSLRPPGRRHAASRATGSSRSTTKREMGADVQANADLMSPVNLFLQADAVVKLVMIGLLLASIWTWAIIFTHRRA